MAPCAAGGERVIAAFTSGLSLSGSHSFARATRIGFGICCDAPEMIANLGGSLALLRRCSGRVRAPKASAAEPEYIKGCRICTPILGSWVPAWTPTLLAGGFLH